jgi:deoxyribose-phosphate aldolase
LTPAERQKRYRERQKAKLAAVTAFPLRDDKTEVHIAELNRENDALAIKVDRLARALQARDNENDRLRKRLDELVDDLAHLRSRVARWKGGDGSETAAEPIRPKARRKKAVT